MSGIDWFQIILTFILGLAGSFGAWLLALLTLRPSIRIADEVSCRPVSDDPRRPWPVKYRIKIQNIAHRNAFDIRTQLRLEIKGLPGYRLWSYFSFPEIEGVYEAFLRRRKGNRIVSFRVKGLEGALRRLPPDVRRRLKVGHVTLEELLSLGSAARLGVVVTASDSFSKWPGATRTVITRVRYASYFPNSVTINPATTWREEPIRPPRARNLHRRSNELSPAAPRRRAVERP